MLTQRELSKVLDSIAQWTNEGGNLTEIDLLLGLEPGKTARLFFEADLSVIGDYPLPNVAYQECVNVLLLYLTLRLVKPTEKKL